MVQVRCLGILSLVLLGVAKPEETLTQHLRQANDYVLAHTRYSTHRLPKVVWLSRAEMDKESAEDDALCHNNSGGVTEAMESDGVMYLTKNEFELGRDDQILVHELVHFQQDTNSNESQNDGVLENEAYVVQTEYVKDTRRGEPPDPEMVAAISQEECSQ